MIGKYWLTWTFFSVPNCFQVDGVFCDTKMKNKFHYHHQIFKRMLNDLSKDTFFKFNNKHTCNFLFYFPEKSKTKYKSSVIIFRNAFGATPTTPGAPAPLKTTTFDPHLRWQLIKKDETLFFSLGFQCSGIFFCVLCNVFCNLILDSLAADKKNQFVCSRVPNK